MRYVFTLMDLSLWRELLSARRPGTPVANDTVTTDEADAFTVPLAEAIRALVQPWQSGGREISSNGVAALRQLALMTIETARSLQSQPGHDPVAWRVRLAMAEEVAILYRKVCRMPLAGADGLHAWLEKPKRFKAKLHEASEVITGRSPGLPEPRETPEHPDVDSAGAALPEPPLSFGPQVLGQEPGKRRAGSPAKRAKERTGSERDTRRK